MNDYRSPGFYPDPEDPTRERWWNGQGWSDSYQGDDETDTGFPAPAPSGDGNSASPAIQPGTLDALEAFASGAGVRRRKTPTVKEAFIFTSIFALVGFAINVIFVDNIILGILWVAMNILIFFMLKRQAEKEAVNPEPDLPEVFEAIRSAMPEAGTAQPVPRRPGHGPPPALPQISPEVANKAGRAFRNAVIAVALGGAVFAVGVLMIFGANGIWGTPGEDGATSLTGAPAFLAIIGFLLAFIGFLAPIPVAIITFIITLKKQ